MNMTMKQFLFFIILTCFAPAAATSAVGAETKIVYAGEHGETVFGVGSVYDAAWSPDGKEIAAACSEGLFIFDANDMTLLRYRMFEDEIKLIAWAPDGERIFAANRFARDEVWGTPTIQRSMMLISDSLQTSFEIDDPIRLVMNDRDFNYFGQITDYLMIPNTFGFSPHANLFAALTKEGIKIWDSTGEVVRQFGGNDYYSLQFDPSILPLIWTTRLEIGRPTRVFVDFFDMVKGIKTSSIELDNNHLGALPYYRLPVNSNFLAVIWYPGIYGGSSLYQIDENGLLKEEVDLYRGSNGRYIIGAQPFHLFQYNQNQLIISLSNEVFKWDMLTFEKTDSLIDHQGAINSHPFHPSGERLLSLIPNGPKPFLLERETFGYGETQLLPDVGLAKKVLDISDYSFALRVEKQHASAFQSIDIANKQIRSVSQSILPNPFSYSFQHDIAIMDTGTQYDLTSMEIKPIQLNWAQWRSDFFLNESWFIKNSNLILTGYYHDTKGFEKLQLYDLSASDPIWESDPIDIEYALSPPSDLNSSHEIVSYAFATHPTWATTSVLHDYEIGGSPSPVTITELDFSARELIYGDDDTIYLVGLYGDVYQRETNQPVEFLFQTNPLHQVDKNRVALSPDSRRLVVDYQIWDVENGVLLGDVSDKVKPYNHVEFTESGETIVFFEESSVIRVWNFEQLIEQSKIENAFQY